MKCLIVTFTLLSSQCAGAQTLPRLLQPTVNPCDYSYIQLQLTWPTSSNVQHKAIGDTAATSVSVSATYTPYCVTEAGVDYCCSDQLQYSYTVDPIPSTPGLINFDQSTMKLTFAPSNDNNDANLYTVWIDVWFASQSSSSFNSDSSSADFYYTDTRCPTTSITGPVHPMIKTSVLVLAESTVPGSYDLLSGASEYFHCGPRVYSMTISSNPLWFVATNWQADFGWDGDNNWAQYSKLTVYPKQQPQQVGLYTFQLTTCLYLFMSICYTTTANAEVNDCIITAIKIVQAPSINLGNQNYALSSSSTFNIQLSASQTPGCNYTSSAWSIANVSPTTGIRPGDYITLDSATGLYSISPGQSREGIGQYTIAVTSVTLNGQNSTASFSITFPSVAVTFTTPDRFLLTVTTGCESTVITATSVSPVTITVWDAPARYPSAGRAFVNFTDSASTSRGDPNWCVKIYSATITTNVNGQSLSEFYLSTSEHRFQISSQNLAQIGSYTASLTATIEGFPTIQKTVQFQITVIDPCLQTTLIQPQSLNAMTTSVLVQNSDGSPFKETQQVGIFEDSVSLAHGSTGTEFCSARIYSISSVLNSATTGLSSTELTINSATGLISVYTARSATVGTHSVTVTVKLTNYLSVSSSLASFTFEILPCIVTSFTMNNLSPSFDKIYTVADPALSWSIVGTSITTQVPACGYTLLLSINNSPPFVSAIQSGQSIFLSVSTRDVQHSGEYEIEIAATLQNYNFSPPRAAPYAGKNFVLTTIDPCLSTLFSIIPNTVENFVTFAGYKINSSRIYSYNDTQTILRTLSTDKSDFCGEKKIKFTIEGAATSQLSQKNADFIFFNPPKNNIHFGMKSADVIATLSKYPQIHSSSLSFTVTTLGSVVPVIQDQIYTVGQQELQIVYDQFKVLPEDYDPGKSSVDAYLLSTDMTSDQQIDLNCGCLELISNLSWISFSNLTNILYIRTSDISFVGEYSIAVVKSFENFPDVHPYQNFKLKILPMAFTPKNPPFFYPALPSQIDVVQCQSFTGKLWQIELPQIIDPNESPISLQVQLDEQFFYFNPKTSTIRQKLASETPLNKTIKFKLQNELGISASHSMVVRFFCPSPGTLMQELLSSKSNITTSKNIVKKPAWIGSISRRGVVEIKFYQDVFVPNFTIQLSTGQTNHSRRLNQAQVNFTLREYINKEVLQVQIKSQHNLTEIDWHSISYSKQLLKMQLNFTNPIEVSQGHQDQLIVRFKLTDLFLLHSGSEYLFHNESDRTLYFVVPKQLPNTKAAEILEAVTDATETVGWGMIIGTLVLQIIAKKVITTMWIYFCALQLILLIILQSKLSAPASVEMVVGQIAGIINLSSLDKDKAAKLLHLESITQSAVFQSLDGVALSAIGILLVVLIIGVALIISRYSPRVYEFFQRIKQTIFWNFLIRYFQAAYIGFNFAALSNLIKAGGGPKDIVTSAVILVLQYALVTYAAFILFKSDLERLSTFQTKLRIGNLYHNLDTRVRPKIAYGLLFFIQRSLIVLVLTLCQNSIIQWQLSQIVLLLNTAYLLTVEPYMDPENAVLDQVNCFFLMVVSVLQSTYQIWNSVTEDRFFYGMGFDGVVILQFFVSLFFILSQASASVILKLKQRSYRLNYRQHKQTKKKLPTKQTYWRNNLVSAAEVEQLEEFYQELVLNKQPKTQQLRLKSEMQATSKLPSTQESGARKVKKLTEQSNSEAQRQKYFFNPQMSEISEREESEGSIFNQKKEKIVPLKPDINLTLDGLVQKKLMELMQSTNEGRYGQMIPEQLRIKKSIPAEQIAQNPYHFDLFRKQLQVTQTNQIDQDADQVQYINSKTRNQIMNFQSKSQIRIQDSKQSSYQPQTQLTSFQQQILDIEVGQYFTIKSSGVRLHSRDKIFTWHEDIWPYYKQTIDPTYQASPITQDQHVQQMVQHLKRQWIETYPEKPYLPLQMTVDFYIQSCDEIAPWVRRQIYARENQT